MIWTASVCQLFYDNSCKEINYWQNFTMCNKLVDYEEKLKEKKMFKC